MKQNDNGFTLIEIALTLAIAGAIFAAVFIALSGVWADERDNERRDDMMTFIRMLKNYQTNNSRGALPVGTGYVSGDDVAFDRTKTGTKTYADNSWAGFYRDYFNDGFTDPDGPYYNLKISTCTSQLDSSCGFQVEEDYTISVITSAVCYGEDAVRSANSRNVAVLYDLEAGGIECENT